MSIEKNDYFPPFAKYDGQESFFGGQPPLPLSVGYVVVLVFGAFFSIATTLIMVLDKKFGRQQEMTSEHFNTAGRMIKTGLTASVIVSQWTWAATILQSSNVAWAYGVSGPFWYASGATIQVLLFGVIAISLKKVAPSAHTMCEIVNARWGRTAHITFLFFAFSANIIVTSMLLLGGAATVQALTGMNLYLAAFLIPWGVILYTASGGLKATFLSAYLHTIVIMAVLVTMIFVVYIKVYSSDTIHSFLEQTVSYSLEECEEIFSNPDTGETFFVPGVYACGPVTGNNEGSYLTMLSSGGLMFGIINIIGNFGTVFVDNSYWLSAIAARPSAAAKGYLLGGICWFAIPFSLATSLGLTATALMLPITSTEAAEGLVPPATATEMLGSGGAVAILIMLFMAITSTGSAEAIAVSSLCAYDIYREYYNPEATGEQILKVSRIVVVVFCLGMGGLAILLFWIGLNLGWVYLFMGIIIGSAVAPLWNLMTWERASGKGAVVAAWSGLFLAVMSWIVAAKVQGGSVTVATLGTNEVMLSGNLVAIFSSAIIHYVWSKFIDHSAEDYDFAELDKHITLVEQDLSGLGAEQQDPVELEKAYIWISRRGYVLTLVLIILWPALSAAVGVFSKGYFSFWVLISLFWGFGAAIVITVLPVTESKDDVLNVCNGIWCAITGREHIPSSSEVAKHHFEEEDSAKPETPLKEAPADEPAPFEVVEAVHLEEHTA